MTKNVRIENADNNLTKEVVVEIWEQKYDQSAQKLTDQFEIHSTRVLPYPTTLDSFCLHNSNYVKIYERDVLKKD